MLLEVFPINTTQGRGLKILTVKQVLKRLPWARAQIKAVNTFEELLNEKRQVIYSLYWEKGITKKVYINIINPITI